MNKLRSILILFLVAWIPAAAPPLLMTSPDLCFAAGSITYQLSADARAADYRVAIDNQTAHPDLRIRLVDQVETADFALTDDAMIGSGCKKAGLVRSARIVPAGAPADITIAVSREPAEFDFSLYVYSARVSHFDAAALFALIRRTPKSSDRFAETR